ncbi:uncharacterized protein LOC110905927 [Helianthus annuus]|uniref:uncharacterized protein LOC110905927 n=1 Tax=Helianthus annuus TaxID=4232 RepID=UPI0016532114|nr:uncharacterized protein LOC110905927 [Helianthus annuus]
MRKMRSANVMRQNDLISGEWLPILSSKDLGKLIRDAMNGIIKYTINGSSFVINVENLGRPLVQHIMKDIVSSLKPDKQHFKYLLSGLKLLHTLWNIASHHPTLARKALFLKLKEHLMPKMLNQTLYLKPETLETATTNLG